LAVKEPEAGPEAERGVVGVAGVLDVATAVEGLFFDFFDESESSLMLNFDFCFFVFDDDEEEDDDEEAEEADPAAPSEEPEIGDPSLLSC